jgi:tetratricopeptide (TPR) repeat protein
MFIVPLMVVHIAFAAEDPAYKKLWNEGEYEQARNSIEEHIGEKNGRVPLGWTVDRAELHFLVGDVDQAIALLDREMGEYYPEPSEIEALARYYDYRGLSIEYRRTLDKGKRVITSRFAGRAPYRDRVAIGRLLLMLDQPPKTILSAHYDKLMEDYPDKPGAFIAAGDLAYTKKGYDVAARYYEEALALTPNNQNALCGLAECFWQSYDPRLEETVNHVLGLNPNNPRIRAIQAEKLLESGKFEEAIELIDAALAINPNATGFLALKTAALFLLDDQDGAAKLQQQAIAFNPKCSEVYRIPGRIASRHYRFQEGVEFQAKALEVNPNDRAARALYAFDLLRVGREDEGLEQLELAFDEDPYDVQVYNMLTLMDSMSQFEVVERGDFKLQVPADEADILVEDAFALLEEAGDHYQEKYRIELETPVLIQIFDNHDDFMVRALGLPGNAGHLGICFGQLVTMDSPSAREPGTMNWQAVLWHEFVHVITLQKTKNRMPRWLSEGISVYEETQRSSAWGQDMMVDFKPIIEAEPLPDLDDIEAYFTEPKSTGHLMLGYFVAGEFIQHYVDTYSQDALVDCLERIAAEESAEDAITGAAGVSKEELEESFKIFLKERLAPYDNLPKLAEVKTEEESILDRFLGDKNPFAEDDDEEEGPSPFQKAMADATRAIDRKQWNDAVKALEKAHALFPDYSAGDAPLFQLVHVYTQSGNGDKLVETLERIIAEQATPFSSMNQLFSIYQNRKRWDDVVRVAQLAIGINPFDIEVRKALLAGQRETGDTDAALITLSQLAKLDASRDIDYLLDRARLLGDLERWGEAREETLGILERTPHFWEAQEQLLRIVDADQVPEPESPAS